MPVVTNFSDKTSDTVFGSPPYIPNQDRCNLYGTFLNAFVTCHAERAPKRKLIFSKKPSLNHIKEDATEKANFLHKRGKIWMKLGFRIATRSMSWGNKSLKH